MSFLRRIMARRRSGGVVKRTTVAEVEWHRNEELRPDRLGPGPDDINPRDETTDRPQRTLGPPHKY